MTDVSTRTVEVCALSDLAVNEPALADIDGTKVAMVRTAERDVHAIEDTCSHANVSLSEGEVDGCTLECWLHGSRFDLQTGEPTGLPATQPVAVYPVTITEDDRVLVELPGPAGNGVTPTMESER
ncbi:MAG: non-heme iron oxygenase ferredoxin subunit [Nostocoides sp.]